LTILHANQVPPLQATDSRSIEIRCPMQWM
jgi:hypothetical protein